MDWSTYGCDMDKCFTMRVLECEDFSTPDEFNVIKEENLVMSNNQEELNENSLLGKDDAIIERRKTIEEEIRVDGLSSFTNNDQEIIVDEIHEGGCNIRENINHCINIDIEEGLMEQEKNIDQSSIQDDDPQRKKSDDPEPLLELILNQISWAPESFNFNPKPVKNVILRSQSKLSNEENLIKCRDGNFDFRRKVSLRSNSSLSNKENAFKCGQCNKEPNNLKKSTFSNYSLQTQNPKSGKKRFRCAECGKKFTTNFLLNRHNLIHSGLKPFECHYCNKRFIEKFYLMEHLTIHTGEKPYKCKQCNFKCRFSSNLGRHVRKVHLHV